MAEQAVEKILGWEKLGEMEKGRYYCVEIPVEGFNVVYQFKIWNGSSASMFFLVRADSAILSWLKLGKRSNMKYYQIDRVNSDECLDTEIHHITRQEQGRFKGHYLVDFEILEKPVQHEAPGFFPTSRDNVLPFHSSLRDAARK